MILAWVLVVANGVLLAVNGVLYRRARIAERGFKAARADTQRTQRELLGILGNEERNRADRQRGYRPPPGPLSPLEGGRYPPLPRREEQPRCP